MQVPLRALVLHEMIGNLDIDIATARSKGEDVTALEAERKRLANQAMFYLNQAVKVKRPRRKAAGVNTR